MSDERIKWRLASHAKRGQQRQLKPSSMLIGSFQIERAWKSNAALLHDRMPRRSCFKPNVEYVLHLCQRSDIQTLGRIRIFRCVICGKQFCWRQREPRIAAFGLDALRDRAHAGGGHEDASICLTECGDGKSPRTLTADAPIRPAFKHSAKSIAPPLWEKLDCFVDGFKRHRSERSGCGFA